jgi:triacylglycerol esterase/lipase EstA (alpha/beta hydrolase family)
VKLIVLLFTTLFLSHSAFAEQEVVVLVPGFFNTFAHEYFSNEIVQAFQKRGFTVYVTTGLNPIGTVEDNGARLSQFMDRVEQTEHRQIDFNVVAHSAGGLYTLFVANQHKHHIKNLITVATPFKGVEFLQKWLDHSAVFKAVTDLAHLDGLKQLTPQGVAKFLETVRVAPDMKITAFAGTQKKGLDVSNAQNLSVPFRLTSACISEESDGIVGLSSALGVGSIKTTENRLLANQRFNNNYRANLEHWEQVLEGYSFLLLGIRNPGYVIDEQARFYGGLADYLLTSL